MSTLSALYGTTTRGDGDWRERAACVGEDPELWFPNGVNREAREQEDRAKAICNRCDVRVECLTFALNEGERFGVWGGSSEDERAGIKRKKTTNRLTPDDVARIHELAAEGMSDRGIAERLGVHRSTVSTTLRAAGRPDARGKTAVPPDLVERIRELHAEGNGTHVIAEMVGRSQSAVYRALTREAS